MRSSATAARPPAGPAPFTRGRADRARSRSAGVASLGDGSGGTALPAAARRTRAAAATATPQPPRQRPDPASDLACPHYGTCAGCALQHDLASPPTRAAAAAWFASHGVPLPAPTPTPPHAWRARARLAVRPPDAPWFDARPAVGLFAAGTHVVVNIIGSGVGGGASKAAPATPANTPCLAHHPRINAAAAAVASAAAGLGTSIYDDAASGRAPSPAVRKQQAKAAAARAKRAAAAGWENAVVSADAGARPPPAPTPGLRYLQLTAVAPSPSAALARPPHADPDALIQAVLVWGGEPAGAGGAAGPRALADRLWADHGPGSSSALFHSISLNFQPHAGNAILGAVWEAVAGAPDDEAWQVVGGVAVSTPPPAFCQANPAGFGRLLSDAGGLLGASLARTAGDDAASPPPPITLADLFAGSGAVGLALAAAGLEGRGSGGGRALLPPISAVRAVDVNAAGGPALAAGAAALAARWDAPGTPPSFDFVAAPAGAAPAAWLDGADAAVADPPRKGLDAGLLQALTSAPPPSLRALCYVACHFPSLARDGDALLASGHWRLGGGVAHVLFPGADAVEAVAVFERVVRGV